MIKYSFVIPSYNYKDYLINCLESLNHQSGFGIDDYEVVVVDDGSNDGTYDSIMKMDFSFKLKYIYIERTKDSCRNAARNKGWRAAEGDYIIFLDADMIVNKDYLQNINMCYEMDKDISIMGLRFMLSEPVTPKEISDGSIFRKVKTTKPDMCYYEERHYFFNKLSYNACSFDNSWIYFYSCNISIPKKYLYNVGGFNENLPGWGFDDQELGYRLVKAGVRIITNQKLESLHQYHGEIYGTPSNPKKILEWHKNIVAMYKIHKDIHKSIPKLKLLFCYSFQMITKLNKTKGKSTCKDIVHITKKSLMEEYKASIKELTGKKAKEIVVYDHVENSDLHIWVQLLDSTRCNIKYFPVSRILDKDKIKEYHKYLKKKFGQNRILYLIKMFFLAYIKPPKNVTKQLV
jgi:glycosyltransferase involved in cell wall biosynthesis